MIHFRNLLNNFIKLTRSFNYLYNLRCNSVRNVIITREILEKCDLNYAFYILHVIDNNTMKCYYACKSVLCLPTGLDSVLLSIHFPQYCGCIVGRASLPEILNILY